MKSAVVAKAIGGWLIVAAVLCAVSLPTIAVAASEVTVGGYHDEALRAAQLRLTRGAQESPGELAVGDVRISVNAGDTITRFTPRFGGLGLGRPSAAAMGDVGSLLKTRLDPEEEAARARREVRIGPDEGAEIAGLEVNWTAIAAIAEGDEVDRTSLAGTSGFLLGGELALSAVRVDAAIGQEPDLLGLEGRRVSAGVAYDFGLLDARLGYSRVQEDETSTETSLFTLGSRLNLRPGLTVQGDLAYAQGGEGDPATAGLVSLRFSF